VEEKHVKAIITELPVNFSTTYHHPIIPLHPQKQPVFNSIVTFFIFPAQRQEKVNEIKNPAFFARKPVILYTYTHINTRLKG
jgi:hypothetical protein